MTRNDIIRMAKEAEAWSLIDHDGIAALERFAKLVAAAEREACASVDVQVIVPTRNYSDISPKEIYEEALMDATLSFRAAIRARREQ